MRRIITSLFLITATVSALAIGATGAFFSDTETSIGNTFAAGAIDLKIDNESYYNGNKCAVDVNDVDQDTNTSELVWQGSATYPEVGTDCSTSFPLSDLDDGLLFFNFTDLKPDDEGEDTISIHVQNDAWACMDVTLTSNDDVSTTEPEDEVDVPEDINNTWDGELAQNLQFFWWADDGDNVYEVGENSISNGIQTLMNLASTAGPFSVPLADANNNVWGNVGEPLPANETVYIAKAWCFGTLTLNPVLAGQGVNPSIASGVNCDGTALGNETQTDSATVDVAFRAIQARHNGEFVCNNEESRLATITVIKQIINDNGGNNVVADYQLFVDNGIVATPVTSGVSTQVVAGAYVINETGVEGYSPSFSGDCDVNGQISLISGDNKTCTITNNDLPANITLIKNVINDTNDGDPNAGPTQFGLRVDGFLVQNNTSTSTSSNVAHSINEDGRIGYSFVGPITGISNYGKLCPAVLGGTVTLDEGEAITCTITNDDN